jgi:hypothetical protein
MAGKEPWNILEEAVGGLELGGDTDEFMEEGGAGAAESDALSGDTEVLAGESADEQINGAESPLPVCPLCAFSGGLIGSGAPRPFLAKRDSNISGSWDRGPAGGEDALAEGLDLDLREDAMPRRFKAMVEASDA